MNESSQTKSLCKFSKIHEKKRKILHNVKNNSISLRKTAKSAPTTKTCKYKKYRNETLIKSISQLFTILKEIKLFLFALHSPRSSQSSIHLMNLLSKSARAQKAHRQTRFKMPATENFHSWISFRSARDWSGNCRRREWIFFRSLAIEHKQTTISLMPRFSSVRVWRILRLFRQMAERSSYGPAHKKNWSKLNKHNENNGRI